MFDEWSNYKSLSTPMRGETGKAERGEVEKRKEETRRDASLRYAHVLALHGNTTGCSFLVTSKASSSVTKYVDGIDT